MDAVCIVFILAISGLVVQYFFQGFPAFRFVPWMQSPAAGAPLPSGARIALPD